MYRETVFLDFIESFSNPSEGYQPSEGQYQNINF